MRALTLSILLFAPVSEPADLKPETVREFGVYMADADRQMKARETGGQPFLWSAAESGRWKRLLAEGVLVAPTRESPAHEIERGLVHDWTGAVWIPGAKAEHALKILRDVNSHPRIYAPETLAARRISGSENEFRSSLRTLKKKVITAVLDYEFQTTYRELGPGRWQGVVRSTRIVEVEDYGEPNERQKPEGTGFGFLWRLNSWWNVQERNGGVVMELRSISLTRDIPFGFSWAIKPMVTSMPRETIESTLTKTRAAVLETARQGAGR